MQPERVTGERRPATVLFVDVVGSTSLAERMDPEDWAMTMERAMAIMSGAVERYDGWVASHTGDGLMALFGLPTAHEDDPARAVSSAIEMADDIEDLADELRREAIEFQIRVGINSGVVVVRETAGGIADQASRLYGDTLNVAARMQSEAPPGGIMITGETRSKVSGLVESRHVGPVRVKGKSDPIEAYEVLGRTGVLRSVRGIAGLRSPMVGRAAELEQLVATLAPIRAGVGRMAVIEGEPGIGKSRLVAELRARAEADDFGVVEARTVSYGRNLPLHLAIDLVRALIGLPDPIESIPADEAAERLATRLRDLDGVDAGELAPILEHLLSLPVDSPRAEHLAHMEPQTLRLRYTTAVSDLVSGMAQSRPLVMVCDDVHWADEASVDLLLPLVTTLSSRPVLWVLCSRAERDVPGRRLLSAAEDAFGDGLAHLRLRPLGDDDGRELVANLLAIESLPASTRALILDRAEGNPLFLEEIIRMLIDDKAIELRDGRWVATDAIVGIEIPETLHGLLLARIDRLPSEARRVLRVASVIGRTFPFNVLDRVVKDPGMTAEPGQGLGRELGALEGAGLISLAALTPELEYIFRHALIQDAAYATLLKQERRALHLDVAECLLQLYPDRREELAPVLAHHFERADDHDRALEYLVLAAELARDRFARREALAFARRALALLPDGDEVSAEDRQLRIELRLLEAEAGADSEPLGEALALLQGAIADAEVLADAALSARAWLLVVRERVTSGEQYRSSPELVAALERATASAEASGSPRLVTKAMLAKGHAHYTASEFPQVIELFERAIPTLVEAEQFFDASIAAWQLGTAYGHVGDYEKGVSWTDRSYQLGLESGDPNATLDADLGRAIVEALRGDSTAAIEYATKAADVAGRVDNKACELVAHSVIGEQHLRNGDLGQAAISFEASADLATFCQFMPVKIEQTELLLQTARARSGMASLDFERYERALELSRQFGDRLAEAQLHEQRARDRIDAGQPNAVGADLGRAATLYDELGANGDLLRIRELETSLPPAARA